MQQYLKRPQYVPLFLGWVFTNNFCRFLSDVRGSMRVLQLVHVDVKGHGVRRGQMLTEPERAAQENFSTHFGWQTCSNPHNAQKGPWEYPGVGPCGINIGMNMVCMCTRIRFGLVLIHQRVSGNELRQSMHVFTVLLPQLLQVNDALLLSAVTELKIRCFTDEGEVHWRARLRGEERNFSFLNQVWVLHQELFLMHYFHLAVIQECSFQNLN